MYRFSFNFLLTLLVIICYGYKHAHIYHFVSIFKPWTQLPTDNPSFLVWVAIKILVLFECNINFSHQNIYQCGTTSDYGFLYISEIHKDSPCHKIDLCDKRWHKRNDIAIFYQIVTCRC